MRVGVDLDGVMTNFADTANIWLASFLGVPPRQINHYEWWRDYGSGAERAWKLFWEMVDRGGFWNRWVAAYPGAVFGVNYIAQNMGHEVSFVTNRPKRHAVETRLWLDRHGLPYPVEHVPGSKSKCSTGHDVYIDDNPDVIERMEAEVLIWHRPWNHHVEGTHVCSWTEVHAHLTRVGLRDHSVLA